MWSRIPSPTPQLPQCPTLHSNSLTSHSKALSCRSVVPGESPVGSEDVSSASVLDASTERPHRSARTKPLLSRVLIRNAPSDTTIRGSAEPSWAAFLSPREIAPHLLSARSSNTHPRISTQHRGGAQPLGSFSAEHNCPDETVGTCPLPRGPSAAQEQQGGAARGGPSAPEEADRQGSLFRYPGPPPRWIDNSRSALASSITSL